MKFHILKNDGSGFNANVFVIPKNKNFAVNLLLFLFVKLYININWSVSLFFLENG